MLSDLKVDKINWNIERLNESIQVADNYKHNLENIFYTAFNAEKVIIDKDLEGETIITLHLQELTETDLQEINTLAEMYTIKPHNKEVFIIQIFQFKKKDGGNAD